MFLADQVILRELSAIYLGVRPEHAALLACCRSLKTDQEIADLLAEN